MADASVMWGAQYTLIRRNLTRFHNYLAENIDANYRAFF